ncbi:S8 family serine peptidase [Rubrivivax gelatinosus]|nr:S8 family serine peptidase [Rubrivivax gelatinosus]
MRLSIRPPAAVVLAGLALACAVPNAVAASDTTARLVVKYKTEAQAASADASRVRVQALAAKTGVELSALRQTATGATVYRMAEPVTLARARQIAARVAADASVAYALPDVRVKAAALPADPYASMQWSLQDSSTYTGAANLFSAWPSGNTRQIVVAVVDTGLLAHPDLTAHQIGGYDFISDTTIAADGDGRDSDPTDVGDYCTDDGTDSSWHGTSVAGLIAAQAGNGYGVAGGAANNALLLHARVLGRCGGYLSDVADAVVWAAGGSVSGVPTNTTPARVINLSLGADAGTSCYTYLQDAVDAAAARQAVVVVAAGNDGAASVGAPANCSGVIAVGAHTVAGDLASYSNHSADVTLTAPGGGSCMTLASCDSRPTYTIGNGGTRAASAMSELTGFAGTSAATPHVAAAAALLLAVDPSLTPAQVRSLLVSTARSHPSGTYCASHAGQCGAGMLDAAAAVAAIQGPVVTISGASVVTGSATVTLNASATGAGSGAS